MLLSCASVMLTCCVHSNKHTAPVGKKEAQPASGLCSGCRWATKNLPVSTPSLDLTSSFVCQGDHWEGQEVVLSNLGEEGGQVPSVQVKCFTKKGRSFRKFCVSGTMLNAPLPKSFTVSNHTFSALQIKCWCDHCWPVSTSFSSIISINWSTCRICSSKKERVFPQIWAEQQVSGLWEGRHHPGQHRSRVQDCLWRREEEVHPGVPGGVQHLCQGRRLYRPGAWAWEH